MRAALFFSVLIASASAHAASGDGFVLTQWGRWTHEEAVTALDEAKRVGARNISLLVHLCQPSKTSSRIDWCEAAAGEPLVASFQGERLIRLIPEIKNRGMKFSLIIMLKAEGLSERQWIMPNNHRAWFANYTARVLELAVLAEMFQASSLVVGSELTLLFADEAGWRSVIRNVRNAYGGHVTISAFFLQYPLIRFWDALDSIGISSYFPLTSDDDYTGMAILSASWAVHKAHLLTFAQLHGKRLFFVEVGYPNTSVAATQPWDYHWTRRRIDYALAARCWEAFRQTWAHEHQLYAFQIWGLSSLEETPKGFSPIGKRAEHVIKRLFRQRASIR